MPNANVLSEFKFWFLMALQTCKDTRNVSLEFFIWFGANLMTRLILELMMSTNACNCSWYTSVLFPWRFFKIRALIDLLFFSADTDLVSLQVEWIWMPDCWQKLANSRAISRPFYPIFFRAWLYMPRSTAGLRSQNFRTPSIAHIDINQSLSTGCCCFPFKRKNPHESAECIHCNEKKRYSLIGLQELRHISQINWPDFIVSVTSNF